MRPAVWCTIFSVAICLAVTSGGPIAVAESKSFPNPDIKGVRLDWCKHWARQCGKPAADLYCREKRFERASSFKIDRGVGARGIRTLVFGDGRFCSQPTCSSFKVITCERAVAPPIRAVVPKKQIKPTQVKPAKKHKPKRTMRPVIITPQPDKKGPTLVPGIRFTQVGGELIQCWFGTECTGRDVAIEPNFERQTVLFQANVRIAAANGILWQVSDRPFHAVRSKKNGALKPPDLAASGRGTLRKVAGHAFRSGSFTVDFGQLSKNRGLGEGAAPKATFYVRALPIASPSSTRIVGGPTNVIKVLYGLGKQQQPTTPFVFHTPNKPRGRAPLFQISIASFTPAVFKKPSKWGCVIVTGYKPGTLQTIKSVYKTNHEYCPKSYKGKGNKIRSPGDFFDLMADKVTGGWDWLGDKFDALKATAVNVVMKYTGVTDLCSRVGLKSECRKVASTALDAAMASLGVPPTIPSYNELIDRGVEYAVDVAVEQVESSTGAPCIGPCRDALRAGVGDFADKAKRHAGKQGCADKEEAHKHGREPLCIPDLIETRPAPGAIYAPPILIVKVTRRPEILALAKDHPRCVVGADMVIKNFFHGGRVSTQICTGCAVRSKEVSARNIQATLFEAADQPIPLTLAPGATVEIPVIFNKRKRFVFSWTKELYSGSQIDVQPSDARRDWFAVYRGGRAELRAVSNCAPEQSKRSIILPK